MNCSDCTNPPNIRIPKISGTGQDGRNAAETASTQVDSAPTQTSVLRKPIRRSSGGAIERIASDPTELAKVMLPLCAADIPNPSCSIIGSRNGVAPTAMRDSVPLSTETRNVG